MGQHSGIARCDDCRIERELFKDLVGPPCPHRPSATRRRHTHSM